MKQNNYLQLAGICFLGFTLTGCKPEKRNYFQGYVEGEYIYVGPSVDGDLQKLEVVKGQTVEQGALLFQLDPNPQALKMEELRIRLEQARLKLADASKGQRPSELSAIQARLKKAQVSLQLAEREYDRRKKLFEEVGSDAISAEELDKYKSQVAVSQAEIKLLDSELETAGLGARSDTILSAEKEVEAGESEIRQLQWQLEEKQGTAPVGGLVQDTLYREGEYVQPGRPVVSLLPPGNLKIRFFVPQAVLPSLHPGDTVTIRMDGINEALSARISYLSPQVEYTPPVIYSKDSRSKLVFMIEAVPEAASMENLHVGQPVEVTLH